MPSSLWDRMIKRIVFLSIRISVAVILMLLLFFSGRLRLNVFSHVNFMALIATLPFYLLAFVAGIYRWWCLVEAAKLPMSWWDTTRLTMTGIWVSSVIPGGSIFAGDAARTALFAAENSSRRIIALISVFIDRLLGLFAIFIIAAIALLVNFSLLMENTWLQLIGLIFILVIIILLATVIIALSKKPHDIISSLRILKRIPGHKLFLTVLDAFYFFRNHGVVLIKAHLVSYIGHGSMIFAIFILAQGIGIQLHSFSEYLFAISVGIISATIPISGPAGVGAGNVGFALSFALVNSNYGAELALLLQVTLILASQLGLPFFLIGRRRCISSPTTYSK